MFDLGVIMLGEIRCLSLLGVKRLIHFRSSLHGMRIFWRQVLSVKLQDRGKLGASRKVYKGGRECQVYPSHTKIFGSSLGKGEFNSYQWLIHRPQHAYKACSSIQRGQSG